MNYSTLTKKNFILFFFLLIVPISIKAQSVIYHHNFDTYQASVPYNIPPTTIAPEISNSQWTNNTDTQTWNDALGVTGNSLSSDTSPGNTIPLTIFTLTFDVAAGQQLEVSSYEFAKMRSSFGAQNWTMYINGTMVGNGSLSSSWTNNTNSTVLAPISGLTGTVTVSLEFNNHPTGSGSIRIDNFYLYGALTPDAASCPLEITSFSPSYGPANTLVTIEGTGFNDATSVTFDGIDATFAALSDTEIMALVPEGASTGEIVVNSAACSETTTSNFTVLTSECESDIYISEVYDAYSGNPGAVELYNPTSTTINLSGYTLLRYGDIGAASPSYTMNLSGSIAPGDTFIIGFSIGSVCSGVTSDFGLTNGINANDEFELLKNGSVIDNLEIPLGSGNSGKGYTLIRKPDAVAPKVAFDVADWNVYGNEFCSDLGTHTANNSAAPTPDITHPVTQYICENETATFSVSVDGTGYNYQWVVLDNSGNWVNVNNNSNYSGATTDTLTITDVPFSFNGYQYYCYITSTTCEIFSNAAQLNVTESPEQPTVVVTPSDCNADTGTITVSTTSTDPILFYSIDGTNYQVNNPIFTNLAPGEYTVTVKNLSDCVSLPATATVEVTGAPDIADTTVTQPSCPDPFGTITVNSPTGAIYTYSIDDVTYNTDPVFTNLIPGDYVVYVKNDLGCVSETETIEIEAITTLPEPEATTIQPTCDVPTGTIEVTTPLGTEYTYSIDGTNFQSSTTFENLAPDNYNITLKDNSNCTAVSQTITIDDVPAPPVLGTINVTQPDCNISGQIFVFSPVGTGYTYSIDGVNYQSSPVFNNLAAGTYDVTVQLNTCISDSQSVTINNDNAPSCIENPNLEDGFPPSSDTYLSSKGSWFTSHGSPSTSTTSSHIWMWSYGGIGEGTYTCYNFEAGKEYRVCINVVNQNDPGTRGYDNPNAVLYIQASNGNFTPTPTPAGNQVIAGDHIIDDTPTDYDYTFTADNNYNKLWLFPYMAQTAAVSGDEYKIQIFSVTVEEVIADPQVTVAANTATITGTPATGGSWSWSPSNLVTSQNTDNSVVTLEETCAPETVTATFISDCEICSTYTVQVTTNTTPLPAPDVITTQPDCSGTVSQIEITSPTGTGITYSIGDGNGYQSSPVFNNIATGNYDVTIQNEDGCISEITQVTINPIPNAPDVPTLTVTAQPTCNTPTGTIEVTAPTGSDLEYSIDGGTYQTAPVFSAAPGTHTITVQNAAGCTSSNTITVDDLPTVAVPTYTIPILACEDTDGILTFNSPTGNEYEYSIDGGTTFETFTDFTVTPGNYTLVVLNTTNGCVYADESITVLPAPNTPEQALATLTQPTCTTTTGTIEVTSPTGNDLEYSIDGINFQSSTTFDNLNPDTYNVTVQNADGCISVSNDFVITDALEVPATPTVTETQPDCTTATGTIEVTSPIGADLEYSIDGTNFQLSTTFSNLTPGIYDITVQNTDGCTSLLTGIVINDALEVPATPTVTEMQPDCTTATGTIEVTSPTGTDLEYSIDGTNFQSSTTFSNLNQGIYDITVQNTDGCTAVVTGIVINNAPVTPAVATTAQTQPDCTTPTGTIEVTSPTGTDLEYSIDGTNFQSSTTFSNLNQGTYTVTVQNADGCTSVLTGVTIDDAPTIPAIATTTQIQPDCLVTTGTIEVTAPTGTDLEYSIDGVNFQSSNTFVNLTPGTYSITIQNAEGCTSVANNIVINDIPTDPANPTVSETQPNCFNNTGSIEVTSPLGTDLTYSINGVNFQSSTTFNNLNPGTYTITVKNAGNCTAELNNIIINNAPQTPATPVVTQTQPTCTVTTGSIEVTAPLGANLEYSIDGVNFQSSTIFNNLTPGSYNVTVQNADGCTATVNNVIINAPLNIPDDAIVSVTHPTCNSPLGIIAVTEPIGNGMTYSIDGVNYQSQTTFYNVAPGNYTVYVKNAAGCISDNPPSVTINPALQIPAITTADITNPDCENALGTITITSPLGTDLTYSIDNGVTYQSSAVFSDVASGTYFIRVQNGDGCTSQPYQVYVQPQPSIPAVPTLSIIQTDCDNDFGRITVTSPVGPMNTYSIDGGASYQATTTFNNLAPGNYTVQVRNQAGCTAISEEVTIDAPPSPAPDPGIITGTTTICEGESTILENTVLDGIWSSSNENIATVDQDGNVTSVAAGTVTISYTVGTECTDSAEATIRINPLPSPQLKDEYYLCFDEETEEYNSVMLNTGLSTSNFSFVWKKGEETLPFMSNFVFINEPGNYTVDVTNITTGCTTTATTTVNVSSTATATATVGTDFTNNQIITVNVVGGSGDYEFSLNGGLFQDSNIFTNINEGLYTIIVNDKNGCNPIELEVYALNYPRFFSPNGDGQHDTWNISGLRNQREAIIYIYDRFGKIVSVLQPGGLGWDGTYNGERLPATDYWFTLDYQSSDGSKKEFKAHFSLLR
ncbi:T9SS type B sorting domain-containing protein [Flavobacterium suaedae]|uniref:T9SS type B sorting domain-containing protein n=1 Tax=Flavobacterium suaedae TaxID=1767027 RepID=UPI0016678574|nr:T9SS type B sorting domain-containing protein [Flavobacterium suaedae]